MIRNLKLGGEVRNLKTNSPDTCIQPEVPEMREEREVMVKIVDFPYAGPDKDGMLQFH